MVTLTSQTNASIQLIQCLGGIAARHTQADHNLCGCAVHGIDVGEIADSRLIAKVLQRAVCHVEMDAFDEHVDRDEGTIPFVVDDSGIVADAFQRRGIAQGEVLRQLVDEAEFTKFVEFGQGFVFFCHILLYYWLQR